MTPRPAIELERRDARALLAAILARRAGYTPEWLAADRSAGAALAAIVARYLEALAQRLEQVPSKLQLGLLDLAGLGLVPAQAARAPLVFRLNGQARGGAAPARTPVAAAAPPGASEQILYETERALGVTAGKLVQLVSLWPGRDEYIDHSAAFLRGEPVEPFAARLRAPTPHHLYLSHPVLLALSGRVRLAVELELQQGAGRRLELLWEYWDGATWRGFVAASTECGGAGARLDSTDGLTHSGSFILETDCASAAPTTVNGIDGYWLRARLARPLPPDPGQSLPQVDTVRLSSTVNGALRGRVAVGTARAAPAADGRAQRLLAAAGAAAAPNTPGSLVGVISNAAGRPVEGALVRLTDADAAPGKQRVAYASAPTGADGVYQIPNVDFSRYLFDATFAGITFSAPDALRRPAQQASPALPRVDLALSVEGLAPDQAFAGAAALDVSKPFYPLGQQPQPGAAFYFACEEAFGKPLAKVRIYLARALSPQDEGAVSGSSALAHQLDWEYWNSRAWAPLAVTSNFADSRLDLDRTEVLDFTVPVDMAALKVNQKEARWVRVRLQSGSFGFKQTIAFNTGVDGSANSFTYVAAQPPVLASFAIGYTWQHGPFHAERVLAYNDFAYADRTAEAMWPGATFAPFARVRDLTPALYLGFDQKPPADQLGLFFDVREAADAAPGPALAWDYWDGQDWARTPADDETGYLRRPGIVNLLAQADDSALARFDAPYHWLRARLKEDAPPGAPVITALHPNAVWASERHTLRDLPLGASNGTPNQRFALAQTPVLDGERIEVRELGGARANVEWRILAMELWNGDGAVLAQFEQLLARESGDSQAMLGPLRLVRNRQKQVTEAWVLWSRREQLFFSGPDERHYALDAASGRVDFGDGLNGRVPPAGAPILVRAVSVGGGARGNVAAGAIRQLLGVVPGIEDVFNPRAAEGGADGEPASAVLERGPRTLRHRGRALAPADYETLALQASPAVKLARAIPGRSPSGQLRAGWVTLLIVPRSEQAQPYPSFGLREQVRKYVEARAPADLAALRRIHVVGPAYLPVGVAARITPLDPGQAGAVEQRVRAALERFLHPVSGGPDGTGWELGRAVYVSDVAAELERVPGVDFIESLELALGGMPQGESAPVADHQVVAAGPIVLRIDEAGA